jgi:sec-independent protein translocase protein TatA
MPDLGVPELLIIAAVIILLFGSKKLPDAARSLGRSLRIFKTEVRDLHDDDKAPAQADPRQLPPAAPQAAPAPPAPPVTQAEAPAAAERTETR